MLSKFPRYKLTFRPTPIEHLPRLTAVAARIGMNCRLTQESWVRHEDPVQKGFFPPCSNILYAHLGGAPALNGYSYTVRNG